MLAVAAGASADNLYALSLSVIVALVFLVVIRLMDLNEKEPLWAVAMVFGFAFVTGLLLTLILNPSLLRIDLITSALTQEIAKFVAIGLGVAALNGIGRWRGWSEVSGLLDGVVYGAAGGLGFATGMTFIDQLVFQQTSRLPSSPLDTLWPLLLLGLAQGIFGGIIGAGFGAAAEAKTSGSRAALPLVGLAAAFIVHVGYNYLLTGTSNESGSMPGILRWVAYLLPLAIILAVVFYAAVRERTAIVAELADEAHAGVVSEDEFRLLQSAGSRRSTYAKLFFSGDFDGWVAVKGLHSRQVQLALAEARLRNETDPDRRAMAQAEVDAVRASILEIKRQRAGAAMEG